MAITPHTIRAARGAKRTSKRVGRGNASQKGTTAARGTKGQRARSGGRNKTKIRGFKKALQKVPKLRGFKSMYARPQAVSLSLLQRVVEDGATVTPAYLAERNVIVDPMQAVKIVGTGEFTKKVTVIGCFASNSVLKAIEKAGGSVTF
ncbi:MAG TPA: 50S ribosomal protein L15 [Candidatus Kapabacteria bacterium]|nr:50S ribosomal protein L15 [Candidatus Kapabacteria bacterium]